MITKAAYFGPHLGSVEITEGILRNVEELLEAQAALQITAEAAGVHFPVNPKTGSLVSGATYGGWRPKLCGIGAPGSAHKQGLAVDLFDPHEEIDAWCMANQEILELHGIYLEHPEKTPGWSHWTVRKPASGQRVFFP